MSSRSAERRAVKRKSSSPRTCTDMKRVRAMRDEDVVLTDERP